MNVLASKNNGCESGAKRKGDEEAEGEVESVSKRARENFLAAIFQSQFSTMDAGHQLAEHYDTFSWKCRKLGGSATVQSILRERGVLVGEGYMASQRESISGELGL
ncbi:conserved hypothetical protein [Ricinus communis]|uniref:Uncharacterized protein n=1 Tax=Ricinus communis TaxID=3988 RepID=B9SQD6_RICCO|nr:conserved hypothetical protein [Ricinus communis]